MRTKTFFNILCLYILVCSVALVDDCGDSDDCNVVERGIDGIDVGIDVVADG